MLHCINTIKNFTIVKGNRNQKDINRIKNLKLVQMKKMKMLEVIYFPYVII